MNAPASTQPLVVDLRCGAEAGFNTDSRIPVRDVVAAARILLAKQENREFVSWHASRWYDDDRILDAIAFDRRAELLGERGTWPYPPLFNNIWCQEILLSALPLPPVEVIDCLTGLHLTTSDTDATFHAAFSLFDLMAQCWYEAIHLSGLAVEEVPRIRRRLGSQVLNMVFALGWTGEAITAAADDPTGESLRALETMAALRA